MAQSTFPQSVAAARSTRRVRYALLLAALTAGVGTGVLVGANAFGDTVSGTAGDISYCAQWGVDGNATRLAITNNGTQAISSFTFTLPSGTNITGTAGNVGCSGGPASGEVSCANAIGPGQTQFVDILSSQIAVGSTGTLTMKDSNGVAQPGQSVLLQAASVCANGTSTTTCTVTSTGASTSTSTMTTTTPPTAGAPPPACRAMLKVVKHVLSTEATARRGGLWLTFKDANPVGYEIFVTNDSSCPAHDVVIGDALPAAYDCHRAEWHISEPNTTVRPFACRGEGREVKVDLPSLDADQTVVVEVTGKFVRELRTVNVASATASNAPPAHSSHIRVEVLSKKQYDAEALGIKRR